MMNKLAPTLGFALVCLGNLAPVGAQEQPGTTTTVITQPPPPPVVVQQQPPPPPTVSPTVTVHPPVPVVFTNTPTVVVADDRGLRLSRNLMISGVTLFAVTYLPTVIAAAVTSDVCAADSSLGCREAAWPIYVPIVGPFIQMGYISGSGSNTAKALLAIDGVLQAGGVAMFITGAVLRAGQGAPRSASAKRIQVAPYNVSSGAGMMAFGRF